MSWITLHNKRYAESILLHDYSITYIFCICYSPFSYSDWWNCFHWHLQNSSCTSRTKVSWSTAIFTCRNPYSPFQEMDLTLAKISPNMACRYYTFFKWGLGLSESELWICIFLCEKANSVLFENVALNVYLVLKGKLRHHCVFPKLIQL